MPGGAGAGSTSYWTATGSAVSPKFQPARKAARFASRTPGVSANFFSTQSIVLCVGRPYIHDTSPRANRFFGRADLGREVGERGEVVAGHRGLVREATADHLHPVPGVAREADDDPVLLLN